MAKKPRKPRKPSPKAARKAARKAKTRAAKRGPWDPLPRRTTAQALDLAGSLRRTKPGAARGILRAIRKGTTRKPDLP